jgi:Fur family zinc uptake transcriptional regulator
MPQPVFPKPDHDHDLCSATALRNAEALCEARDERLTPARRQVLEALLAEHKPVGAYELIDRLAATGSRPAPITVYRALDFLMEQGLVHRIESRNAFMACVGDHGTEEGLTVFLLCEKCGAVGEAPSKPVADALKQAARGANFMPHAHVIEIGGICANCRKA